MRLFTLFALLLGLTTQLSADEYEWSLDVPNALVAPSDRVTQVVAGAAVQGGLIDLRFGQACVAVEGEGLLLDYDGKSSFTLDGAKSSAKELAQLVKDGAPIVVAVRYDPTSGLIGWMDAVSSRKQSAIHMVLEPFKGPAYTAATELQIRVNPADVSDSAFLRIPGVTRRLALRSGKAMMPILSGWNWEQLPIYVVDGQQVFRGRRLSVATTAPEITNVGPERASGALTRIPGWVEFSGPSHLLDTQATKIEATGAEIQEIVYRRGRLSFWIVSDGVGPHTVKATIVDKLGRESSAEWTIRTRN